ncbi:MAG: hypothetical protein LAO30_07635 [Acidobacteriia bacterium]|nr:hypothetical protein [Terriglobia bacterium]
MKQNAAATKREITIDSDWITTAAMVVLLVTSGWIFIWEMRDLVSGNVAARESIADGLDGFLFFVFAFLFRPKYLKIALSMFGVGVEAAFVPGHPHASTHVQHAAATGGALLKQVALTIIFVAVIQWFRSVVHWNQFHEQGPDS